MESFILAVVVAFTVWLFMRRQRMLKEQRRRLAEMPEDGQPPEQKSMPRIGAPGTITRRQMAQLKARDFEPHRQWSKEEAQLILDTVTYLRAAIRMVTGEKNAPIQVQNNVLGFILGDDELRDHVMDWGLNRSREEEEAGEAVTLADDAVYRRVAERIRALWEEG